MAETNAARAPRRTRRRIVIAGALLGAVAVLIAANYGWWVIVEHRLVVVRDGEVFQSAEMPPEELVRVGKSHAIRSVIDLRDTRPEAVDAERAALEQAGIKHLHVPSRQEPSQETIDRVLGLMADPANQPLLVHCEHGEGRSVLMAALYRIREQGWTNEAAWHGTARLPRNLQFLADLFPGFATFGRDSRKGRILFEFQPAPPGAANATGDTAR